MKTNPQDLAKRGYLETSVNSDCSVDECLVLLKSEIATQRTLGARSLAKSEGDELIARSLVEAL